MIFILASVMVFWNFKQWPKTSSNANVRKLLIGFWFTIRNKDVLNNKLDVPSLRLEWQKIRFQISHFIQEIKLFQKIRFLKKVVKNLTNFETFPRKKWLLLLQIKCIVFIINDSQSLIVDWAFLSKQNVSLNLIFTTNS